MAENAGILREGARRVWRAQRVLWWFFFTNLVLAFLTTVPLFTRMQTITAHSLTSRRLVDGFDVGAFSELINNPDVAFGSRMAESHASVFVFFFFAVFLTGGILVSYDSGHRLTTGEFFQACGGYFWRWMRLIGLMVILLVPIGFLGYGLTSWSVTLLSNAAAEKTGYWAGLTSGLLITLLAMTLRLWFDMAQVRTVIEEERAVRRSFAQGFKLTFGNFAALFWMYLRISILAWLGLAIGLGLWARIPGGHSGMSFFLLEIVLLWWAGTRLWQRASEVVWYQRHAVTMPPPSVSVSTSELVMESPSGLLESPPTNE